MPGSNRPRAGNPECLGQGIGSARHRATAHPRRQYRQGDSTIYAAPRFGIYGPDWHHDMPFPLGHHFYFEYFVIIPMPQWDEGSLLMQSHDGAIITEQGVEYLTPRSLEFRIIQ